MIKPSVPLLRLMWEAGLQTRLLFDLGQSSRRLRGVGRRISYATLIRALAYLRILEALDVHLTADITLACISLAIKILQDGTACSDIDRHLYTDLYEISPCRLIPTRRLLSAEMAVIQYLTTASPLGGSLQMDDGAIRCLRWCGWVGTDDISELCVDAMVTFGALSSVTAASAALTAYYLVYPRPSYVADQLKRLLDESRGWARDTALVYQLQPAAQGILAKRTQPRAVSLLA